MKFSFTLLPPIFLTLIAIIGLFMFDFYYFWFMVLPILSIVVIIGSWALPILWYRIVPSVSKTLLEAARKKLVPALIVHDSGRSNIVLLQERRGEGVVVTNQGNYRLLPRYAEVEELTEGNPDNLTKDDIKDRRKVDYATEWITKRSILVGLGLPFYVGYSGKLCLLNPECLAWYEAGDIFVPTEDNPVPKGKDKKKPMPLMLLNPLKMKAIINKRFDVSQVNAILIDTENLGRLGRGLTTAMKVGIVIFFIMILLFVIFFAPQFLGG